MTFLPSRWPAQTDTNGPMASEAIEQNLRISAVCHGILHLRHRLTCGTMTRTYKDYLEDHPRTWKWLITMVIVNSLTGGTFPFQMAFPLWLINGGDPITTYKSWGPILQVQQLAASSHENHRSKMWCILEPCIYRFLLRLEDVAVWCPMMLTSEWIVRKNVANLQYSIRI